MYDPVREWLQSVLTARYPDGEVVTAATGSIALFRWLEHHGLADHFDDYLTYDIKVDVLGMVLMRGTPELAFVECKTRPIALKDVAQLLGYSRVAKPSLSLIISPGGMSRPLDRLLRDYERFDVLKYAEPARYIRIATWDVRRRTISMETLIPPGEHI